MVFWISFFKLFRKTTKLWKKNITFDANFLDDPQTTSGRRPIVQKKEGKLWCGGKIDLITFCRFWDVIIRCDINSYFWTQSLSDLTKNKGAHSAEVLGNAFLDSSKIERFSHFFTTDETIINYPVNTWFWEPTKVIKILNIWKAFVTSKLQVSFFLFSFVTLQHLISNRPNKQRRFKDSKGDFQSKTRKKNQSN